MTVERTSHVAFEHDVDIARVDTELEALRGQMAAQGNRATLSPAVINLVIMECDETPGLVEMLDEALAAHPGRVVILRPVESALGVAARVSALLTHRGPATAHTYSECLTLTAGADSVHLLPEFALPHLISSVPTALWWIGRTPLNDPLFPRLAVIADRVLIDSMTFPEPIVDLERLARLVADGGRWSGVGDFAWGRLTPWRQWTARLFDMSDTRAALHRLDRVELVYGAGGTPVAALLYMGWLMNRLKWEPTALFGDLGAWTARFRHGSRHIEVDIRPSDACADVKGELARVRLSVTRGETGYFDIEWLQDRTLIRTEYRLGDAPPIEHVARMGNISTGHLLAEELRLIPRDSLYQAALRDAARALPG
ncbi:MAG: glucose-6-phosphate dehydrogenase assembly protein OpcA [Anaerolineae bacterium]